MGKESEETLSKEDIQMANEHMQGCWARSAFREMQIKPTGRERPMLALTRMGNTHTNTAGGNVKWHSCFGKQPGSSSKC
jgi:hypothetical protein